MARTMLTPKKEREGRSVLRTRVEREREREDCQEGQEAPLSCVPPLPSQKALTHEGGGEDGGRG